MNKLLILVVEDDNSVKNLISTTLKAHDYRYLTASNGADAVLEASSHNPDIVLLDLGLPDIDGVDVIKKNPHMVKYAYYCHKCPKRRYR